MSDMEKNETEWLLYEELKGDEKTLLQWYRKNPLSVYIEIALLKLFSLGIITVDEYRNYQSEIVKKADILKESC